MTSLLSGQDVLVLGLGESGLAAARLARLCGARVTVLDSGHAPAVQERATALRGVGVQVLLAWSGGGEGSPDLAVISPGIPYPSALGQLANRLACPVISELEFGYRMCACPILAVTGTNGKTTTVELLTHCLARSGRRVLAAGNIGLPLCAAALGSQALDLMVVEVSSFQLEKADRFAPLAAAITNVTPDHLDRHGDMATYLDTKVRLLRHLSSPADAILRADLAAEPRLRAALAGAPTTFSSAADDGVTTWFVSAAGDLCWRPAPGGSGRIVLPAAQIPLPGRHNLENILTVLALAQRAGIEPEELALHVASFALGPHRLETVAVRQGIRFINDSKATNPDALVRALETVTAGAERPTVLLLAGGLDKNVSFAGLETVIARCVKGVFLVGTSRERLAKLWGDVVSCGVYESLDAGFAAAVDEAVPGDVVLLSPGCASQDMFTDYGERGRAFRSMVQRRFGE